MEDRELLEMAAKAARIHLEWVADQPREVVSHWSGNPEDGGELRDYDWNPLNDDGDALRLAVTLRIEIEFFGDTTYAGPRKTAKYSVSTEFDRDSFATARLAIVRAAAEIGKSMP